MTCAKVPLPQGVRRLAAFLCLTAVLLPATTAQSQQSTDVVIDSTGEVIVNDQSDVLEAGFEDLMRRQRAYEQRLFDQAKKELQAQEAERSTLDQEFDRAADEIAGSGGGEARPDAVMSNILSLEECARNLERVLAERNVISDEHADCVVKTKGSDSCRRYWPLLDAKSAQYEQIDASCQAPGEDINRHFGTVGIARAKAQMKALGVIPDPSPNAGDLDYLVPLTAPPRSGAGVAPPTAPPNAGDLDYLVPLTAPPRPGAQGPATAEPNAGDLDYLVPLTGQQNAGDLDYLVPLIEPPGSSSDVAPSGAAPNAGDLDYLAPLVAPGSSPP